MRRRGQEDVSSKDVYLNGFAMVAAILVLVLHLINPPTAENDAPPPGNLIVSIVWPAGDTDVDLWVMSKGEVRPVGYSNRTGAVWSLLRDDLGNKNDLTDLNFENAYSRTVEPGHYVVNLHLYRGSGPIEVTVEIRVANMGGGDSRALMTTKVILHKTGQEITAVAFDLTADGAIVPGSVNSVFQPLRSARAEQ